MVFDLRRKSRTGPLSREETGSGVALARKVWPPFQWPMFKDVDCLRATSDFFDARSSRVSSLSYEIISHDYRDSVGAGFLHHLTIESWFYEIHGGPMGRPVLTFRFVDYVEPLPPPSYPALEIKSMGCPMTVTERSALRAAMLSVFLIGQINTGLVPDIEGILRIYRLHPTQNRLYRQGATPPSEE